MSDEIQHEVTETVEVPAGGAHGSAHGEVQPLKVDTPMVIWTWVTFAVVAAILYKVAWKPILAALDAREGRIRKSLDDARKAEEELARLDETRRKMLAETESTSRELITKAREAAVHAAGQIEAQAQDKARILYANAEREIRSLQEKAAVDFRKQQVDLVLAVAGRLVDAEMTDERNRALTDKLLKEL